MTLPQAPVVARSGWPRVSRPGVRRAVLGRRGRRGSGAAYLFLLPWIIGCLGLTIGPILASLYFSFTDYDLLSSPSFVGFDNYTALLDDRRYRASVVVTLKYVAIGVPVKLAFALLVAVVLKSGFRMMAIYRAVFYVPSLLGGSVAVAILWRQIFGDPGLLKSFLALFGVESQGWLTNPETALSTLIILEAWQFGSPMLIFLAALRQLPQDLFEAARVDGAGRLRQFRHLTLPLLTPIIFFNLVLQMIGTFQAFSTSFIISNGKGGPVNSTLFYTLYLYIRGFGDLEMGYASAMAWVFLVVVGVITAVLFLSSRYWVFYGDEK